MTSNGSERQLQELGVFVHGMLASLHALGLAYNLRRRNWFDVGMHGSALIYDTWAAAKHRRHLDGLRSGTPEGHRAT